MGAVYDRMLADLNLLGRAALRPSFRVDDPTCRNCVHLIVDAYSGQVDHRFRTGLITLRASSAQDIPWAPGRTLSSVPERTCEAEGISASSDRPLLNR